MVKLTMVLLQPSIRISFLGYLIPYAADPTKIQTVKAILVSVPAIAPFELANGKNIPKMKRPRTGPPLNLSKSY